eukprot:687942-Prymnesium_polylepis.1
MSKPQLLKRKWSEDMTRNVRITIMIKQYLDSPAHVDDPMTAQDASQQSDNARISHHACD